MAIIRELMREIEQIHGGRKHKVGPLGDSVFNNCKLTANQQIVIQRIFKINHTHPRADCFTILLVLFRNSFCQHFIKCPVVFNRVLIGMLVNC